MQPETSTYDSGCFWAAALLVTQYRMTKNLFLHNSLDYHTFKFLWNFHQACITIIMVYHWILQLLKLFFKWKRVEGILLGNGQCNWSKSATAPIIYYLFVISRAHQGHIAVMYHTTIKTQNIYINYMIYTSFCLKILEEILWTTTSLSIQFGSLILSKLASNLLHRMMKWWYDACNRFF